jgi:mannose PTS system EIIC component
MLTGLEKYVLLALIAAVIELDAYFFGITLFSQPVIAGSIAGFILGDVKTGALIGSLVQLVWMMPPVGAFVPPSSTAIAVSSTATAVYLYAVFPEKPHSVLIMFALVGGAGVGYFVGQADIWTRKLNTIIVNAFEKRITGGKVSCINAVNLLTLGLKSLRDFSLYMVFFMFALVLAANIFSTMPAQVIKGLDRAFLFLPALGFAVVFDMFRTKTGAWFHGTVFAATYIIFSLVPGINANVYMIGVIFVGIFVVYNTIWKTGGAAKS